MKLERLITFLELRSRRVRFALDETKLYCIKEGETISSPSEMKVVCDTMLASVREVKQSEVPFCFEVSYANVKTFMLQAEGHAEYTRWLDAIRRAIEKRLTSGVLAPSLMRQASPPNVGQESTGGMVRIS